ncbi:hypothetical protein [Oscillatoria sp. FACHB-1407]|uniref:hypothetical protein n=1 Tax=Oscillatoria sp. FACHB-1407 TaxID=2692847 RepID=UPI0030DD85BE
MPIPFNKGKSTQPLTKPFEQPIRTLAVVTFDGVEVSQEAFPASGFEPLPLSSAF